jgi:CheY-like chemotaxis protein
MNQLKIFVSSTCYDLSQIRADLFDFISNLGYQPVLSEYSSFPIDPNTDTINNCIENVKSSDILILIIGNRYGSLTKSGKSITNTEYLYAKQLGIPIYVFIYKPITVLIDVWRHNKDADFSHSVENTMVFEFVDNVKDIDKSWCYGFEKAQDITSILKIQLSHLFRDSLNIKNKYTSNKDSEFWNKLSPIAIDILLKKNDFYEIRFFVQTLQDELLKHEELKLDVEYKIRLGSNKRISDDRQLLNWVSEEFESITRFIATSEVLFDNAYKKYYGEPGVTSDLKGLYYVSNALARLHKEMLTWSINISSVFVLEDQKEIRDLLAEYVIRSANNIWNYPKEVVKDIDDALERYEKGEENIHMISSLNLEVEDGLQEKLLNQFAILKLKFSL